MVCGNSPVQFAGYVFYENGKTQLKAPFCSDHIAAATSYANPVFENEAALALFKAMHPVSYWQDVADKIILYFDSYKRAE